MNSKKSKKTKPSQKKVRQVEPLIAVDVKKHSLHDLISISLSDRCKLVQITEHSSIHDQGVYQIVNTETLDSVFIREETLKELVKVGRKLFGV